MRDAKLIERVFREVANFLEGVLFLGLQRNKIQFLFQLSKPSILQWQVVVLNYCG